MKKAKKMRQKTPAEEGKKRIQSHHASIHSHGLGV